MGFVLTKDLIVPEVKLVDLKAKIEDVDVLVLFGIGDGSCLKPFSSWLKKEEGRFLVCVETNEELFLKGKELSQVKDPRVRLLYSKEGDEDIFHQIAWEFVFLRFGYGVTDPSATQEAIPFFAKLEQFHRGVDLLASDCEDMGLKVITNVLKNLSLLPKSRQGLALEGKCAKMPAIICGAGPSLDQVLPLLGTLKDKAILIAAGSATRALSAQGIEPHICAHIDPQPPYKRFIEQDSFAAPFFYQSRFSHSLLQTVHAPLFWMPDSGSYPLEAWITAECGIFAERFDAGWTVSNFCASLAAHLGCSTLIFVGMDFSCGPDAIYAAKIDGQENRDALVEIEKDKLYSKRDWIASAEWMGAFAAKNPHLHCINASIGGIDLPGIERKTLAEIASDLLTEQWDVEGIVHGFSSEPSNTDVTLEKVADVRKRIKESFEKCLELCDKLLKVWEKHYPQSPLETGEYAILDYELQEEICHCHFLAPLWNVWKRPILRTSFHPLGQHVHRLLFFKKALEMHLPHLRSYP